MIEHERFARRAARYHDEHPTEREGQALFNALKAERPDLAERVRGTELDPFDDDSAIPALFGFLREHMTADVQTWLDPTVFEPRR